MRLTGKTALVTGGTDGIGAQLIRQLRAKGAQVITTGRNPERVAATRSDGFETIAADLATREGVETLIAAVAGRPIDLLIHNAGAGGDHDFRRAAPDVDLAEQVIALNLGAPIRLICALMPMLQSRPEAMIVNVTSGLAIAPRAGSPTYCATKAGLRAYTMAIRAQLAGGPVGVMEALPPVVETRMTAGWNTRKMSAETCAHAIIAGIERNAKEVDIGMVKALQWAHSLSPALARRIMIKF